ncbi:conserved hypothetical protein [Nitrosomonas nitrosa]|uniref:PD-(D/E)XK nuclease superfamily protein n=1 Tax=Nitrosomonas nitrosa TaxID=52442 RepID=A0A8H8Z1M0_9PROT|nr:PD-(D/E)XK nuclease family protein [Nitrosomonas nitrosa]CAE6516631.1 conserved hypothetical protein [Nitrosomonas nitrosa]
MVRNKVNSLLKQVTFATATLNEARERFSDRLAPEFSIFDYLRTDEIGLSRCIASLLDPKGTHGQKNVFLEAFLARLNWPANIEIRSIELEKQVNGQRRIDIYLRFENGEIIGVENKPWAGDQKNQLSDYAAFIEKEAGGHRWCLIYLSNYDPSGDSGIKDKQEVLENEGKFIRLSFPAIIEWLEECACKSKALVVRMFIEELTKFIRSNVNGKLEMSEENEIKNIVLASSETLASAFHISSAMTKVKEALLKEFRDEIKKKLEDKGFELIWDDALSNGWKSCSGFNIKFKKEHKLFLRFEFNASGLNDFFWGIARESKFIKKDEIIWNQINAVMNDRFGSGSKPEEHWPWWSHIDRKEFSQAYRNWYSSETPWIAIKEKKLADEIVKLAVHVHSAFGENLALLSAKLPAN